MTLPELEQILADVGRLPEARQGDAADCIRRTLEMDEESVRRWHNRPPLPELPEGVFDGMPSHLCVHVVPRDPFTADNRITDELAEAIAEIRHAAASRQRIAAEVLSLLVENDRWEVILPPDFELRSRN